MAARQSGQESPENKNPGKPAISRREFARRAALVTASAAAIPATLLGAVRDSAERAEPAFLQNAFRTSNDAQSAEPNARQNAVPAANVSPSEMEVENTFENILSKYGSRFSEEQKADIRRLVGETQKQLNRLRAFSLDNSDQPATVLKPLMDRAPRVPDGPPLRAPERAPARAPKRGVAGAPAPAKPAKPRK